MPDTLVQRLEKLEHYHDYAALLDSPVEEIQKQRQRQQVLESFYLENTLAGEVANGKTSYARLVEPIYDTLGLWKAKAFGPKVDKTLDAEIERVFGSMNSVGIAPLFAKDHTTQSRNRLLKGMHASFLLLLGVTSAGLYSSINPAPRSVTASLAAAGGIIIGIPSILAAFNVFYTANPDYIKEAAKETDTYLLKLKE